MSHLIKRETKGNREKKLRIHNYHTKNLAETVMTVITFTTVALQFVSDFKQPLSQTNQSNLSCRDLTEAEINLTIGKFTVETLRPYIYMRNQIVYVLFYELLS